MHDRAASRVHEKGIYVHQSASHAATANRPETRTRAVPGPLAAVHQTRGVKASIGGGRDLREPRSSPLGRPRRGQGRARAAQAARTGRGGGMGGGEARARHGGPSDAFCEGATSSRRTNWRPGAGRPKQLQVDQVRGRDRAQLEQLDEHTNRTQTQTGRRAGRSRRLSPPATAAGRPGERSRAPAPASCSSR